MGVGYGKFDFLTLGHGEAVSVARISTNLMNGGKILRIKYRV